ncbi:MAG: DUF1761 domain-containing protein [Bacteroidota bacterium]
MWLIFLIALIPSITGFVYYSPAVAGSAWMKENGFTQESLEGGNMAKMMGLSYLAALFLVGGLFPMVIHQLGFFSVLSEVPGFDDAGSVAKETLNQLMTDYGDVSRNFGHGAFHGALTAIFLVAPALAMNAIFEKKSFRLWLIHTIYFAITLALMGGCVGQFMPNPF